MSQQQIIFPRCSCRIYRVQPSAAITPLFFCLRRDAALSQLGRVFRIYCWILFIGILAGHQQQYSHSHSMQLSLASVICPGLSFSRHAALRPCQPPAGDATQHSPKAQGRARSAQQLAARPQQAPGQTGCHPPWSSSSSRPGRPLWRLPSLAQQIGAWLVEACAQLCMTMLTLLDTTPHYPQPLMESFLATSLVITYVCLSKTMLACAWETPAASTGRVLADCK